MVFSLKWNKTPMLNGLFVNIAVLRYSITPKNESVSTMLCPLTNALLSIYEYASSVNHPWLFPLFSTATLECGAMSCVSCHRCDMIWSCHNSISTLCREKEFHALSSSDMVGTVPSWNPLRKRISCPFDILFLYMPVYFCVNEKWCVSESLCCYYLTVSWNCHNFSKTENI